MLTGTQQLSIKANVSDLVCNYIKLNRYKAKEHHGPTMCLSTYLCQQQYATKDLCLLYVIWVLCEQGPAHGVMVIIDAIMILSISLLSVLIVLEYQLQRQSIISVASTDHERLDIDTSLCSHTAGNKTI